MGKRSMTTDNQLIRGLGGRHCWANQKRLDQGATTGLLCVLQNDSPIFRSFLNTMLTQNIWYWWAGGVPWCHHFVGSNPHGYYHFVGVPIPFCRGVGWAPYTLVGPSSRGEFQGGWKYQWKHASWRFPIGLTMCPILKGPSCGQSCTMLEPNWAEIGAKWARPKLTPGAAHVAAMLDRNGSFAFWRPAGSKMQPQPKLYQSGKLLSISLAAKLPRLGTFGAGGPLPSHIFLVHRRSTSSARPE